MEKINFANGQAPYINDTNLNQMQDNVEEAIEERITTGEEFATNEYIDGNRVYRKRFNCGQLPDTDIKNIEIDLNLSQIVITKLEGIAHRSESLTTFALPFASPLLESNITLNTMYINGNYIQIRTGSDRTNLSAYVDIYYTKNS